MHSRNVPSRSRRTPVRATVRTPRTLLHVPSNSSAQPILLRRHADTRLDGLFQLSPNRRTVPSEEDHLCLRIYSYFDCGHETEHIRHDPACYRCAGLSNGRCTPESVEVDQDGDCPACTDWRRRARRQEERRRRDEQVRREDAAREARLRLETARARERATSPRVLDTSRRYQSF